MYDNSVLPASQTSNLPTSRRNFLDQRIVMLGAIAIGLYALIIGWGFRGGWINIDSGYLFIAVPCLLPIVWYSYGYFKITDAEQDFGLLLSAGGWALIAFGLLIKDSVHRAALIASQAGVINANTESAPAATICLVLAFICLVIGAYLSWDAWRKEQRTL